MTDPDLKMKTYASGIPFRTDNLDAIEPIARMDRAFGAQISHKTTIPHPPLTKGKTQGTGQEDRGQG